MGIGEFLGFLFEYLIGNHLEFGVKLLSYGSDFFFLRFEQLLLRLVTGAGTFERPLRLGQLPACVLELIVQALLLFAEEQCYPFFLRSEALHLLFRTSQLEDCRLLILTQQLHLTGVGPSLWASYEQHHRNKEDNDDKSDEVHFHGYTKVGYIS